ncbi:alpha-hydroxy acid oxidase [Pseudonocardia kunmingensis]|uniref:L-lactate dehydrogenase (Cytochrome) n=1 Tax=Pseudonocardia kunmingensis TaxID=630975 RepID=A0A543DRK7_9PSEU|nr:alpha-hydroxy acid oxidase [Pseudonocardia kunmingensis]TQM11929.1 L-lactate dehydrogenase (cytochrome) [Pseudonocardia kunmingensis]
MRLTRAHSVEDLRRAARRRMPKAVFDVVDGGAGDEQTLRWNRESFARIPLRPRALVDVRHVDTTTTVLGDEVSMPLLLAPCSFARMCHSDAEAGVARAAGRAGTVYVVPGGAGERPEVVIRSATGPLWYQLYLKPDRAANAELLDRVEAAGYRTLCVTIDTAIKPYREKDLRNGVTLPVTPSPRLALAGLAHPLWSRDFLFGTGGAGPDLFAARRAYRNFTDAIMHIQSVTAEEIRWLRDRWPGPLVLKGVLRGEEVAEMVELGVDGIVVSNHGGRNLDGVPATVDALPEVVEAAAGRAEVLLDGGVRRGTDVVRALALGAKAVLVGRPYMFGLAAGGEPGVDRTLELLHNEIIRAMSLVGARSVKEIDRSLIGAPQLLADARGGAT